MIFELDTTKYESIKLVITDEDKKDGLQSVIGELCFALAGFFVDFASKLDLDKEQTISLKDVCISCISNNIDEILGQGILEEEEDFVDEEELESLRQQLSDTDHYSEEEIADIVELVKSCGSIDSANEYLKDILDTMK